MAAEQWPVLAQATTCGSKVGAKDARYLVVAKRKDVEGKRLARFDPQIKANIGQMRSGGGCQEPPFRQGSAGWEPSGSA